MRRPQHAALTTYTQCGATNTRTLDGQLISCTSRFVAQRDRNMSKRICLLVIMRLFRVLPCTSLRLHPLIALHVTGQ